MYRRAFLRLLGLAAPVAAMVSETPVFGKNDAGDDVVSVPIVIRRDEVVSACEKRAMPALLREKAASISPILLALHVADKGWIERSPTGVRSAGTSRMPEVTPSRWLRRA